MKNIITKGEILTTKGKFIFEDDRDIERLDLDQWEKINGFIISIQTGIK